MNFYMIDIGARLMYKWAHANLSHDKKQVKNTSLQMMGVIQSKSKNL